MWKVLGFVVVAVLAVSAEQPVRYDDYKVFKVFPATIDEYQKLKGVEQEFNLDFWREMRWIGEGADIMVPPQQAAKFEEYLQSADVKYDLMIENVQSRIEAEKPLSRHHREFNWTSFHTLDEINAWIEKTARENRKKVTLFTIGKSYEGRDIKALKISRKKGNKAIFIESNIHGCEWAASAIVTYIIDKLLNSHDPVIKDIAKNLDWIIVPVLNVDGFDYSHKVDRLWRKSRKVYVEGCIGADMNRNFDAYWMYAGASSDPCAANFAGTSPNSEPEVELISNFVTANREDYIEIYISMHSYAQLVLSPWGHTTDVPVDYERMMYVAKGFTDAASSLYGTPWNHGSSALTLYKVSGASKDWAYVKANISIPFTIELRDRGVYGFVMPPEEIIPTAQEALAGYIALIKAAREVGVIPTPEIDED